MTARFGARPPPCRRGGAWQGVAEANSGAKAGQNVRRDSFLGSVTVAEGGYDRQHSDFRVPEGDVSLCVARSAKGGKPRFIQP